MTGSSTDSNGSYSYNAKKRTTAISHAYKCKLQRTIPIHITMHNKGPLTVSMQICPLFDKLLQPPRAAKAELVGINK